MMLRDTGKTADNPERSCVAVADMDEPTLETVRAAEEEHRDASRQLKAWVAKRDAERGSTRER